MSQVSKTLLDIFEMVNRGKGRAFATADGKMKFEFVKNPSDDDKEDDDKEDDLKKKMKSQNVFKSSCVTDKEQIKPTFGRCCD